jgi:hypothetical protein
VDVYRVGGVDLPREGALWRNNRDPDPTLTTEYGAGYDAPPGAVCLSP